MVAFATHLTRKAQSHQSAPGELIVQFVGATALGVIALISVFTSDDRFF